MAHVQYQTSVPWDSTLADLGYTSDGYVESAVKTTTGAPTATAGKFIPAAQILNKVSGITYTNTGSTASPTWTALGGGGGGTPGGSNTMVQVNTGGSFAGYASFLYDNDARSFTVGDTNGDIDDGTKFTVFPGNKNGIIAYLGDADDSSFQAYDVNTAKSIFSASTNNGNPEIEIGDTSSASITINSSTVGDVVITPDGGKLYVRDTNSFPYINLLKIDTTTKGVEIGDTATGDNYISIIDAAGQIFIRSATTISLLSPAILTGTSLPAFADDAAAALLPPGQLYQTTGAGAAPLNVAGIVMVKQ